MLAQLRSENARLIALLEAHSIEWHLPDKTPSPAKPREISHYSTADKVALFRRLFRGRDDVYPVRWDGKTSGKSGFSPACANEWRVGVCEKPRIKCGECSKRLFIPLTDSIIYDHLAGEHTIGVYPLLSDDTCHFVAVDFDDADWREDAKAFLQSCRDLGVPAAIEISRSGNGAHAWIFFSNAVAARDVRRLASAIISYTCTKTRQLQLASYDRLFPNQDSMPKGGFGNLIALPLQKSARERHCSVFVDDQLNPYPDQWTFLSSLQRMPPHDIEPTIFRATGGNHPLDISFIDEEDYAEPWKKPVQTARLAGPLPSSLTAILANLIYFEKEALPPALANRMIRLAAFQNPKFYQAQAMRMSVWDTPRVIACAVNYPSHIAVPRGCISAVEQLLKTNNIELQLRDERFAGESVDVTFAGVLRADQERAVTDTMSCDFGVLCAPTAFGKTVTAAAIIARRATNTLILVHRTELLKQWQERLQTFLGVGKEVVGTIGGGKPRPTKLIDIAVMQSLSRQGEVNPLVEHYGQVIVDECHHIGAISFEAILKQIKAKYVLGLTATPIRRDGQQPIIFMQCGPICHVATRPEAAPHDLEVIPYTRTQAILLAPDAQIQDVFRHLAENSERTEAIADEINKAFCQGRKVLVLTERTDHIESIRQAAEAKGLPVLILHGRMSKKQRSGLIERLEALPPDAPRILLATGKLVGEGFDHPPLDTLILAMPISWKGNLQQYAGRLHREHATKTDVRIIDFVDAGHPALLRMWDKRKRGYRAMGYRVAETGAIFAEVSDYRRAAAF